MHPIVFGEGVNQSGGGITPEMLFTLIFTVVTLTLMYVVFLQKGIYIEKTKIALSQWKEQYQEKLIR